MRTITTEIELITPEMAQQYLSTSLGNRPLNKRAVRQYAAMMQLGRWAMNGESICFDSNGALVNGHHRLHAIMLGQVPVEILVVRGVDPKAWFTYDTGKMRSGSDVFQIAGVVNPFEAKATVAKCEALRAGRLINRRNSSQHVAAELTAEDLLEIYRKNDLQYQEAIKVARSVAKDLQGILAPSYISGVAAYLNIHKSYSFDVIKGFWENLALASKPCYREACDLLVVSTTSKKTIALLKNLWHLYINKKDTGAFNGFDITEF